MMHHTIQIGGLTKPELLARLTAAGVQLNEHARTLFALEKFTTSPQTLSMTVVELSVGELGFAEGTTIARLEDRAAARGLLPCPLELAAYLRLQYHSQPEGAIGFPATQHRAPPGSLTVASAAPRSAAGTIDDEIPRGFYLRRIEGVLWLRGYCSDAEHVWSAEDRWVFCRSPGAGNHLT